MKTKVKEYGPGTLAYYQSALDGLIPVKVLRVDREGYGWEIAPSGRVLVEVAKSRRDFFKGVWIAASTHDVFPVECLKRTGHKLRVDTRYKFVTS
jgi:hypothetical protein